MRPLVDGQSFHSGITDTLPASDQAISRPDYARSGVGNTPTPTPASCAVRAGHGVNIGPETGHFSPFMQLHRQHRAERHGHVIDVMSRRPHSVGMTWQVAFHHEFVPEFRDLPVKVQDEIYTVGRLLEQFGPQLGRPRVDTLNGSRHANMKEMRSRRRRGMAGRFRVRSRAPRHASGGGRQAGRQRAAILPDAHPQGRRAVRPAPCPARR